jgi:hypothetical protein
MYSNKIAQNTYDILQENPFVLGINLPISNLHVANAESIGG